MRCNNLNDYLGDRNLSISDGHSAVIYACNRTSVSSASTNCRHSSSKRISKLMISVGSESNLQNQLISLRNQGIVANNIAI